MRSLSGCLLLCFKQSPEWLCPLNIHVSIHLQASHSTQTSKHRRTWTHYKKKTKRSLALSIVEYPQFYCHTQREGWEQGGAQGVCVCVHCCTKHLGYSSERGWRVFLARRPVIAQTQLGSGDGHLVCTGGAHFWREVDDAAVVLHILEFVLLGGLHVDH